MGTGIPDFSGLPPTLQIVAYAVFALSVITVLLAARFGIKLGRFTLPSPMSKQHGDGNRAQVAAMIVDSSSLDRGTAALEALNITLSQTNSTARGAIKADLAKARRMEDMTKAVVQLSNSNAALADLIAQYIASREEERHEEEIERIRKEAFEEGLKSRLKRIRSRPT